MADDSEDIVDVPGFDALLKTARELKAGDDKGVAKLMAEAVAIGLNDVQADMVIKAAHEATKVGIKVLWQAWVKALAAHVNARREAEAPERERREAEVRVMTLRRREEERKRIWASCRALAESPTLLNQMVATAQKLGLVNEGAGARGVYLACTSRLLANNAVRLLRLGSTASGKNYPVEVVLLLIPADAVVQISGSSPKVLPYFGGEDPDALKHKVIYIPEAVILDNKQHGVENEFTAMLRTLISEGRLVYHTVVTDKEGSRETVVIIKNGPIAAVLTTARDVDREMKTRSLVQETDETGEQTDAIVRNVLSEREAAPDLRPWLDLQLWLEEGAPYRVDIPFRRAIADAFDEWWPEFFKGAAMRMRRDITSFLVAIEASALLHKAQRPTVDGVIVATVDDYNHAYEAFGEGLAAVHGQANEKVIATVEAIEAMRKGNDMIKVTLRDLAKRLRVGSPMTASARLAAALEYGAIEQVDGLSGPGSARYFEVLMTAKTIRAVPSKGVFPPPKFVREIFLEGGRVESAGQTGQREETDWV
jgi:hypothetical protein